MVAIAARIARIVPSASELAGQIVSATGLGAQDAANLAALVVRGELVDEVLRRGEDDPIPGLAYDLASDDDEDYDIWMAVGPKGLFELTLLLQWARESGQG